MSRKIIHRFGGAWWDTLFILIKDNDQEFILDFVDRMPCDYCRQHFLKEAFNYNFNQKKEELYKILWKIRCNIDKEKYGEKKEEKYLKEYLRFLYLIDCI